MNANEGYLLRVKRIELIKDLQKCNINQLLLGRLRYFSKRLNISIKQSGDEMRSKLKELLKREIAKSKSEKQWERQFRKGQFALRGGRLCKIIDIDYLTMPPSVTVEMQYNDMIVGTEFTLLKRIESKEQLEKLQKAIETEKENEDFDLNDVENENEDFDIIDVQMANSPVNSEHPSDDDIIEEMEKGWNSLNKIEEMEKGRSSPTKNGAQSNEQKEAVQSEDIDDMMDID